MSRVGDTGEWAGPREFRTTRWSLVLSAGKPSTSRAAGDPTAPGAREALGTLAHAYWYPLYVYARRRGHGPEEAKDLIQGYFARLFERRDLEGLSPERGRFRAWLLASLKNYLAGERERERALKRGGGEAPLSFEVEEADERYRREPVDDETPERAYERSWAHAVLGRALEALGEEYRRRGKEELFEALRPRFFGEADAPLAALAAELATTEGALKVSLHRMRQRFREVLRAQIVDTVSDPREVALELDELFRAL